MRQPVFRTFVTALCWAALLGALPAAGVSAAETAAASPAKDQPAERISNDGEKPTLREEKQGEADLINLCRGIYALEAVWNNKNFGVDNAAAAVVANEEVIVRGDVEMDNFDVGEFVLETFDGPEGVADVAAYVELAVAAAPEAVPNVVLQVGAAGIAIEQDAAAPEADPNAVALERQLIAQYQPLLQVELSFAERVCDLTKAQRELLAAAGKESLKMIVKESAEQQKLAQQGKPVAYVDPRKRFRKEVAEAVKTNLSSEQEARYDQELAQRAEYHKQTAVANLVVMLDAELVLTAEQRNKLAESLSSHWQDNWVGQLEIFMYGNQFFPPVPNQFILPFLRPSQQSVWQSAGRRNQQMWIGGGVGGAFIQFGP